MTAMGAVQATTPPPAPRAVVVLLAVWHKLECWIAVLAFSFIALVLMVDVMGR